jgi:hypothetical protein
MVASIPVPTVVGLVMSRELVRTRLRFCFAFVLQGEQVVNIAVRIVAESLGDGVSNLACFLYDLGVFDHVSLL